MNFFETVVLGIIQGLTEWLPISSSGHLVILHNLLGLDVPLIFDVALHVGTLIAVIVFFLKDLAETFVSLVKLDFKSEKGRLITYVVAGSVPITLIGFMFHDRIEQAFVNPLIVYMGLIASGVLIYLTKYAKNRGKLDYRNSIIIGTAQAAALIPGISRSGFTISTARILGIQKEVAFKFSFFMAVPAVIGASIFELSSANLNEIGIESILIGTITSAIVGYMSLRLLYAVLQRGRFHLFAYYCWIVGISALLINLFVLLPSFNIF